MIDEVVPIPNIISAFIDERMESHHSQLPTPVYKALRRAHWETIKIWGKPIFRHIVSQRYHLSLIAIALEHGQSIAQKHITYSSNQTLVIYVKE